MNHIQLAGISKTFDGQQVLNKLDLTINEDEFLTLLGPSGCGKTTLLRIIGGFTEADEGKIFFEGKDISGIPANLRPFNTVFQQYALFPHLNVEDNVAFGLRMKKVGEKEIKEKVEWILDLLDLPGFQKRKIDRLSGGQQQRIAIARALVNDPEVLLLDEPLAALDAKLRRDMQIELKRIQREVGITFIFVTHDQEEALTMSDRIVVMNRGKILQIGSPIDIYNEPQNRFVADFIGESNIVEGIMPSDCQVIFSGKKFKCVDKGFRENEPVDVVIRPEDVELVEPDKGMIMGKVVTSLFKGVHYEMEIEVGDELYLSQSTRTCKVGSKVGISIDPENIQVMHKFDDPAFNPTKVKKRLNERGELG